MASYVFFMYFFFLNTQIREGGILASEEGLCGHEHDEVFTHRTRAPANGGFIAGTCRAVAWAG